ncbi:MAG: gamma-glutamyl-gamma-aminobutyrate hydrolase family protein [Bacilli bacterium]
MKPIIGIILRPEKSIEGNDTLCIYKQVSDAIIKHGGIPLGIIPPNIDNYYGNDINNTKTLTLEEVETIKRMIDLCDGIICQGGDDYYDYDLETIKYSYKIDKPLLGICLGMQAMGVAFNGEMDDLNNQNHLQKGIDYVHKININTNSKLYEILQEQQIIVNSRHKSTVIKTDLDIVGMSDDNIIEALEDKNKTFFIGLQWHPESMIEYDVLMNRLFAYFIKKCR